MDYYIGNTDYDWFNFLKNHNNPQQPEDINFWKPGGKRNFRAIKQGEPFLLKLKKEHSNKNSRSRILFAIYKTSFGLRLGCV